MKKIMWIFGVAAIWFLSILPVRADVIWEPQEPFYQEHARECEYVNRKYTAAGLDGQVKVYYSPENATVVDIMENGNKVHISFTYTDEDGICWGIVENREDIDKTGWVPMEYMEVVYDYISFQEEFGASFVEENGVLPEEYAGKTVKFWSYPGAAKANEIGMPKEAEELPWYDNTFVDETGLKWGYIGYFYGMKNYWICLDNASGTLEELYPDGAPVRGNVSAEAPDSDTDNHGDKEVEEQEDLDEENREERVEAEIVPKGNGSLVFIVSGLVAAVVALTGGLLFWLKKK